MKRLDVVVAAAIVVLALVSVASASAPVEGVLAVVVTTCFVASVVADRHDPRARRTTDLVAAGPAAPPRAGADHLRDDTARPVERAVPRASVALRHRTAVLQGPGPNGR